MISIVFALLQSTAPAAPAPPPWTAVSRTDATTGATATSAAAFADDRSGRLVVRCDKAVEPVVSVQLRTKAGLAAADDHIVSISVDGGTPIALPWEFPGVAAMNRVVTDVTQLTLAMSSAKQITATTTDGTTPVTLSFVGPGSGTGIKDVLAACGYQLGVVPTPVAPPPPAK